MRTELIQTVSKIFRIDLLDFQGFDSAKTIKPFNLQYERYFL